MAKSERAQYKIPLQDSDIIIDNSTMKETMRCSLAAVVRYGLDLAPAVEGAAMLQGQAGHASMAEWLDTGSVAKAMGVYEREYAAVVPRALAKLPATDPRTAKERARLEYGRTAMILKSWYKSHPLDSWALVVRPGETELPISAKLMDLKDGRRVVFVALVDALARRRHGGLYSTDHKFRKGVTDWWVDKQEDSAQFTGQVWLGRQWEMDLAGVYVNAVEIHDAKTSERKCSEHGMPYKDCDTRHARHKLIGPLTKSKHELAAWEATMRVRVPRWIKMKESVETLEDVRAAVVTGKIPTEGRWNESCTFCGLRDWCRQGRPTKGTKEMFVKHHWNPLAERRGAAGPKPATWGVVKSVSVGGGGA